MVGEPEWTVLPLALWPRVWFFGGSNRLVRQLQVSIRLICYIMICIALFIRTLSTGVQRAYLVFHSVVGALQEANQDKALSVIRIIG